MPERLVKKSQKLKILTVNTPFVVWFTGLSGSGKSTLGVKLTDELLSQEVPAYHLDGDSLRTGLNYDLGFSREDRRENVRRAGEVAKILSDSGTNVIASFISPYAEDRLKVRKLFKPKQFVEVYLNCPLEICQKRDVKGLYRAAKHGKIKEFTGISQPYEKPKHAEIVLDTNQMNPDQCLKKIFAYLNSNYRL